MNRESGPIYLSRSLTVHIAAAKPVCYGDIDYRVVKDGVAAATAISC